MLFGRCYSVAFVLRRTLFKQLKYVSCECLGHKICYLYAQTALRGMQFTRVRQMSSTKVSMTCFVGLSIGDSLRQSRTAISWVRLWEESGRERERERRANGAWSHTVKRDSRHSSSSAVIKLIPRLSFPGSRTSSPHPRRPWPESQRSPPKSTAPGKWIQMNRRRR